MARAAPFEPSRRLLQRRRQRRRRLLALAGALALGTLVALAALQLGGRSTPARAQ